MKALSSETVLALHALHGMMRKGTPVTVREIGRSSGFREERIRPVLARLREAGLIEGRRGRGFVLARSPGEITLRAILDVTDVPRPPTAPCDGDFDSCASRAACMLAPLCRAAEKGFQEALRSYTLSELGRVPLDLPNCLATGVRAGAV
jgi:Rrf2 family protein